MRGKSLVVDGETLLIPPLVFAHNSIFQKAGEFLRIEKEEEEGGGGGGNVVVVSSESTEFSSDWMIRQGFPNWYMLL